MKSQIQVPLLFIENLVRSLRDIFNKKYSSSYYHEIAKGLIKEAISLLNYPNDTDRILRSSRDILYVLYALIDNKLVSKEGVDVALLKYRVINERNGDLYAEGIQLLKRDYDLRQTCYVFPLETEIKTSDNSSTTTIIAKIGLLKNTLSELSEDISKKTDNQNRTVAALEEEVQALKLKVSQYEEDKAKSIPKGAAKAVTFNRIIDFIETCYKVEDTRPIVDMLYKLMRSGNVEEDDYKRIDEAVSKVQAKETQNRYGTTFNGPIYNSGTITGDINNNKESSEK